MNWEDNCYLLSKRKFRENANIINIFTEKKRKSKWYCLWRQFKKNKKLSTNFQ